MDDKMDSDSVQGATVSEVKKLIQGLPNSDVTIHVQRGASIFPVKISRAMSSGNEVKTKKPRLGEKTAHQVANDLLKGKGHDIDVKTQLANKDANLNVNMGNNVDELIRRHQQRNEVLKRMQPFGVEKGPANAAVDKENRRNMQNMNMEKPPVPVNFNYEAMQRGLQAANANLNLNANAAQFGIPHVV